MLWCLEASTRPSLTVPFLAVLVSLHLLHRIGLQARTAIRHGSAVWDCHSALAQTLAPVQSMSMFRQCSFLTKVLINIIIMKRLVKNGQHLCEKILINTYIYIFKLTLPLPTTGSYASRPPTTHAWSPPTCVSSCTMSRPANASSVSCRDTRHVGIHPQRVLLLAPVPVFVFAHVPCAVRLPIAVTCPIMNQRRRGIA